MNSDSVESSIYCTESSPLLQDSGSSSKNLIEIIEQKLKHLQMKVESLESNRDNLSNSLSYGTFFSLKKMSIKPEKKFIFDQELNTKNIRSFKNKLKIVTPGIYNIVWTLNGDNNIALFINDTIDLMTVSSNGFNHIVKLDCNDIISIRNISSNTIKINPKVKSIPSYKLLLSKIDCNQNDESNINEIFLV